jgi:hypothetical protein
LNKNKRAIQMQSSIVLNLVVIADENYVYEENVGGCRI